MAETPLISNVSDTARWVAAYRAIESARPDALFHDPLAERLAGERGRAMTALGSRTMRDGWPMVVRTRIIDDLIAASLEEGCDCVVNLAAGLDTRPYRMRLDPALPWIEADLGPILAEKERMLAGETPRCRLRREPVDLGDAAARTAFLGRATADAKRALVLTEGLLVYLDDDVVRAIGRDVHSAPNVRWWVIDVIAPAILDMLRKGMGAHLEQAPMKFAPPNGVAFFETLGWKARNVRSYVREAARLRRGPFILRLLSALPDPDARRPGRARWSAAVRFERT